ncbi:MAG TPA: DMT family transporter [Symbiobacteriaceae bacterium]|jgi:drug/metabolite transporter (DMT)-like permease
MSVSLQTNTAPSSRLSTVDFAMLLVMLIWGVNAPIVKASLHGWDPLAFNAIRFPAAAIVTFTYVVITDKGWRLDRKDFWYVVVLGLVGNGLYQFLYVESISRTTASNTSLIIAMSPLVVTIWGGLAKTDRVTGWVVGGTLISVAGAALVVLAKAGGFAFSGVTFVGDVIAVGSMFCWGAYTVYAKPVINRVGSPLRVTAWAMLFGAMTNFAVGLPGLLRQDYSAITGASVAGMTFSFLLALALGYVTYNWAVQRLGGARTAIYLNLSPIIAGISSWLMINEGWAPWQWVGALLVIGGVTVAKMEAIRG